MNRVNEKFFIGIICNAIILVMLFTIGAFCFQTQSSEVLSVNGYEAIYRGNQDKKQVSLMFNVYWGNEYIDGILNTLKKYNVKTTFFIGGMWAEKYPELLKKIDEDGHELGNHGYFHKNHSELSYERNHQEINATEKMIESITSKKTNLFAPPSGDMSYKMLQCCQNLGYKTIMWSKDTIDWRDKNSNLIYTRATKALKCGDLILMHPTEKTLEALDNILAFYKKNDFHVVTVSENIAE